MYFHGTGVPQDHVQAYMWTNLAAAQGVEKALKMLDSLAKKLTPSQIEEGQKLVRDWIATHPQAAQ
ncbi:MAG: SEL1-like repeat protein [Methylococcaceae bacterium]|nr:SEL1-like repeat protein [Methylococcaceae bacterium]MDD1624455.1 SEL1-like repeat protein [Methylococcaceae bacterium]MDD1629565.1 SEL1-like repeat protein [Methylococcaceae bacterium]